MSRYKRLYILSILSSLLVFSGCKKQTEEHNAIRDSALQQSLLEMINADANLSVFAGYLKQTGYDTVLSSSQNYTVFAPPNTVLQSLDPVIVSNAAKLKKFIGSHIAYQLFDTKSVTKETRIQMLNKKYHNMLGTQIEDATITAADKYAANGLLQVINKILPALDNSWEFITNSVDAPAHQKAFMLSLFQNVFDTSNAIITGVNPTTGEPIYQAGTDSIFTNLFWNRVTDLRDEKKQITLFMLTDAAWDAEVLKYKPYFVSGTTDSTTLNASWNVLKDFAIDTIYTPATIPATILSKFNTQLPIQNNAIVKTIKTSNGIIYIMSALDVAPASKFKPYLIEAENYTETSVNRRSNTYFRERNNPVTGKDFTDVLVFNHGVARFNIRYEIKEVPSIKYKAYWVAVNDFQAASFTQALGIGSAFSATLPYITVNANVFDEIYLGEFTMAQYMPLFNIYLTTFNSTTQALNPLVCDYIRLEPSL